MLLIRSLSLPAEETSFLSFLLSLTLIRWSLGKSHSLWVTSLLKIRIIPVLSINVALSLSSCFFNTKVIIAPQARPEYYPKIPKISFLKVLVAPQVAYKLVMSQMYITVYAKHPNLCSSCSKIIRLKEVTESESTNLFFLMKLIQNLLNCS